MQRTLQSYHELPPECLGDNSCLMKSMNLSINLANPAHYDANDIGCGINI